MGSASRSAQKKPALTLGVVILLVIGRLFLATGPLAVFAICGVRREIDPTE